MKKICFLLLLVPVAVMAQSAPEQPSEEMKKWALKRAYHLNGDSMVRWGSIDLTDEVKNSKFIQTERIIPLIKQEEPTFKKDATVDTSDDTCTRHDLRKGHCRTKRGTQ